MPQRRLVQVLMLIVLLASAVVGAQSRGGRRPPTPGPDGRPHVAVPRAPAVRGHLVFVGGYFYDPYFGPYPWWRPGLYPYPYYPVFDARAQVKLKVTPKTAAVYVDGFYAGIIDDFDGTFQALPLPPGGHTIVLYLDGYRTARHSLYLRAASTLTLRDSLERLPPGSASEPPPLAPPVPPPPDGSTTAPRTPPPAAPTTPVPAEQVDSFGTLELTVQPRTATVLVDGARWVSSDEGRFVLDVPEGTHRVEVFQQGYARYSRQVDVKRGENVPLNVSLMRAS